MISYIPLSNEGITIIDTEDLPLVSSFKWYKDSMGYSRTTIPSSNGDKIYLHRLLMNSPKNMLIDHINHNKLDNRKSNLRIVTQRGNLQNLRNHGLFPLGVTYDKRSMWFKSQIKINGKSKHLGIFKDPISGSILYKFVDNELKGVV